MIVDANLLIYAVDSCSPHHEAASAWLTEALNGHERVALPWQTIGAFLRISTHPRLFDVPLTPSQARGCVERWMATEQTWIPAVDRETWQILAALIDRHRVAGNLVPDAQLAALAVRHGLAVVSADSDFARFPEVRWHNPLV